MADTINLEASQKIVSVQGLDHYHEKAMAEIDEKINSGGVGKAGTGENAEIFNTDNLASGNCSHAEGDSTIAAGIAAHAEGYSTSANKDYSHSEGYMAVASGISSHSEGYKTRAMGDYSHAEGNHCSAHGVASHAGGSESVATGDNSFTHGDTVKANNNNEIAFGAFNASNADTLFSVGNGTSDTDRSNAFEVTKTTGKLFNKEIATKEEIEAHAADADIHVTADEKAYWNTLRGANFLDNPDFHVNQREKIGTITKAGYFVDRWKLINGSVIINPDGTLTLDGTIRQILERAAGADVTASASAGTASYDDGTKTFTLTASGEVISWAKLETGNKATPFVSPDPATELLKCQRYFTIYKHQNATSSTDKCTIGVGYALTSSIVYAVLPIAAMRSGVAATVSYSGLSLINGTDTVVDFSSATALEQTDSTVQVAFTVSGQTPGAVYRLRLMNSDAYLAVSKEM